MVRLHKSSQRLELNAPAYTLSFDRERPWLIGVATADGSPVADLFVGSSVDTLAGRDELEPCGPPYMSREADATRVEFRSRSSRWDEKRYLFDCRDDEIEYHVEVVGRGRVDVVHYWQGCLPEDAVRLGLGPSRLRADYQRPYSDISRGSRPHFLTYYTARPTAAERDLRLPFEDDVIDLVDDPQRHGGCDSFLPAIWAQAWEAGQHGGWVGLGLAATEAELGFESFAYQGGAHFGFAVDYGGRVAVDGNWSSPSLLLSFGSDEARGALSRVAEALDRRGLRAAVSGERPEWWSRPVFDGAGQQDWLAGSRDPRTESTLANYLDALALLQAAGAEPGVVWIGPGWSAADGHGRPDPVRWPDLSGFVARQHAVGRRVVLTWPLWAWPEAAADDALGWLLSADGAGIDGLRVTEVAPPEGGVLAVRDRLARLRSGLKQVRPDGLLIAPTVNPAFADLVDMVPLGGLWSDRLSVAPALRHRAWLAELAVPGALRAVGDWGVPTFEAWREAQALAPELGVPVLSAVGGLSVAGDPLTPDDLREVGERWRAEL